MMVTDYYKMEERRLCKRTRRLDCVASTGEYEPFEDIARRCKDEPKRFYFYVKNTEHIKADVRRRASISITNGKHHITSIFVNDLVEHPLMGYGDTRGTDDALLFLLSEDGKRMEVFVARGQKGRQVDLWRLLVDGDLNEKMDALREKAHPTNI